MKNTRNLELLAQEFEDCQEVLIAIGDQTTITIAFISYTSIFNILISCIMLLFISVVNRYYKK